MKTEIVCGVELDCDRHRLALPLLKRRLALMDDALRGRGNPRHVYSHGAGYGELLALAVALDKGLDFRRCSGMYDVAVSLCNTKPFTTFNVGG